ncbi:MAG TPA: hypothetical protein VLA68_01635 [Nitrososphaera sp.]|nr:hypothetical protein [Nitrososphaera sp.]
MDPGAYTRLRTSSEYKVLKQEKDLFKRRILFLAFFTDKLRENAVEAIVVGGEAIDLYTAGTFATSDIDLVVNNKAVTEKLLNKFGFGKKGNGLWFNRELNIVIQVIPESYSGNPAKLRKFKVKGYELKVAAPEDLIANRLYSAKFWKTNVQRDLEQAISLLKIFSDSIDSIYLDGLAKRDGTADYLAQVREYASRI